MSPARVETSSSLLTAGHAARELAREGLIGSAAPHGDGDACVAATPVSAQGSQRGAWSVGKAVVTEERNG